MGIVRRILVPVAVSVALSIPLLELAVRVVMPRQLGRPCVRPDADLGSVLAPDCEYFDDWAAPVYSYHVRTNNLGARMDQDVDVRAPQRRVLLLGDSFTFGWGVERSASFVGILSDRIAAEIPDAVLINTGVGGGMPAAITASRPSARCPASSHRESSSFSTATISSTTSISGSTTGPFAGCATETA